MITSAAIVAFGLSGVAIIVLALMVADSFHLHRWELMATRWEYCPKCGEFRRMD